MLFNNIDMSKYIRIIDIRGRGLAEQELTTIRSAGSEEDYVSYRTKPKRHIEIDYEIRAKDKETLRKKIDEVSPLLMTKEMVPVVFPDEDDRTYYVEFDGADESLEYHHIGIHRGTLFLLRDKYKYSQEKTFELEDISTIENKGTAEANPIFELTAKEKATFAMVSNGADEDAEYNLIGTPADVDEKLVDEKTNIFDEIGDSLEAWDIPTSGFTGSFASDTNGIYVDSYGSGDGWHGPALMREIDPIDDFEIEFYVRVRTEQPEMAFRTSLNFYNENNDELGLLRLWNKSTSQINKTVEARVGPYTGINHENYLISSQNYSWVGQRAYNGIIRVSRKGNVYTFYASHISQRGNHIESITERYIDNNNDFAGRLKFIRIDAAIYGDNPTPNALSISRVKVTRHNEVLVDETPYIIFPGDTVTFDHKNEDLLLNGEPRNDLKNFGGSFFTLKKGGNQLIVTPAGVFDSKIIYSDKYL